MISCTEFILAYNEIFNFLHRRHGREAVRELWVGISDNFLGNLRELVAEEGISGMEKYWTRTLTEEGADYRMFVEDDVFIIEMHRCPSVGTLRNAPHIKKYPDYCEHCGVLYSRIVKDYGFSYQIEYLDPDKGRCRITIRRKPESGEPRSTRRSSRDAH